MIDYIWKGCYYANLLRQLQREIKSKCPGILTKGVLYHQDNAPAHKSLVAMSAIRVGGFIID